MPANFKLSTSLKAVPLWVYLAILGFLTFCTHEIRITADMGWYMNSALNIFLRKGYTDIDGSLIFDRGPVFPTMIAVSFWLLGPSPWSAFWPVRIFCILNPAMVYLLGEKLFGKRVGFAAALLILTSYSMDYWAYRHIDVIWPFFVLGAIYLLGIGFEKANLGFYVLSGIAMGIAILTKEVAVLFLPLPVLMSLWLSDHQKKQKIAGAVVCTAVALMTVLPWVFYLWRNDGLDFILGRAGPWVAEEVFTITPGGHSQISFAGALESCVTKLGDFGSGLWEYYFVGRDSLHVNFTLASGFVVAWICALVKAFRGDRGTKILVLCFLLFLPILFFVGKRDGRLGQTLFFLLCSYLAMASLLSWLADRVSQLITDKRVVSTWLFSFMLTGLISTQVFCTFKGDMGYKTFIRSSVIYKILTQRKLERFVFGPFGDREFDELIQEIRHIARDGDAIMVDWYTYARALHFKMAGKNVVYSMPILWCLSDGILFGEKPTVENEKPIWIHSNNRPFSSLYILFMLFQSQLMKKIQDNRIKYVILTPRLSELNSFFARASFSGCFQEVEMSSPRNPTIITYRVYRVGDYCKMRARLTPIFTESLKRNMAKLKEKAPEKYEEFKNKYLYGLASLNLWEIDKMLMHYK